jgi:hypothetical protein
VAIEARCGSVDQYLEEVLGVGAEERGALRAKLIA